MKKVLGLSPFSKRKLRELIAREEDFRLDRKRIYNLKEDEDKLELTKDVCAIANFLYMASGKGHLIIGQDDRSKRILGINSRNYREARLQQIISIRSDPPPIFTVDIVPHSSESIVIITVSRSASGPHQIVKNRFPAGFPIRRGDTSGTMSTNEVFQAMQVKGRTFTRQRSDYETLDRGARYHQIMNDIFQSLIELGFSKNGTRMLDYDGRHNGEIRYRRRNFIKTVRTINHRRFQIYLSVHPQNAKLADLQMLYNSIDGLSRQIPKHSVIFIHFVHGSISSSYFNNSVEYWGRPIRVDIEPAITYLGMGERVDESRERYFSPMSLPKFYVAKIKSKEDIKARLELIFRWTEQHKSLFEQIRRLFFRSSKRARGKLQLR